MTDPVNNARIKTYYMRKKCTRKDPWMLFTTASLYTCVHP